MKMILFFGEQQKKKKFLRIFLRLTLTQIGFVKRDTQFGGQRQLRQMEILQRTKFF